MRGKEGLVMVSLTLSKKDRVLLNIKDLSQSELFTDEGGAWSGGENPVAGGMLTDLSS